MLVPKLELGNQRKVVLFSFCSGFRRLFFSGLCHNSLFFSRCCLPCQLWTQPAAQVLLGMKQVGAGVTFKPRYRQFYQGLGAVANSVTHLNSKRF